MSEILRIAVSSASASQTYQYQPLQHPDSIRRIKLLPGSGDAPLLCTLSEVRLLDSPTPTYKAISYTWGKPIFSHQIREVESGQDIRITKSLFEALKAIRSKSEHSLLWADAICINQASDEERNHQVAFMTQIYKNASGVLVWLGMLSEDSTNTLHSVLKSMRKDHYTAWSTSCIYDDFFENLAIEFFSLPWFSRVWVVPEYILSPRHTFLVADEQITDDDIRKLMWYLADNKVKMRSHPKTMREPQRILFERIASFEKLRLQHSNLGRPTLFACMADVAVERQCSDPRDYVYAVLGLAKDTFGIMPRYDLSLDDVIRDASLRALAVSPFSVLEWGGLTRGNSNTFPSFVPTLSRLQNPVRPLGESGHYESATHEKSSIELLGRELLSVAGAEIDTIVWIDDKDVLEHIQEEFNTTIESDIVAHFVRQVATDTYHRPDDDDFDKDLAQRCGLSVDHLKLASAFIRVTYLGLFESSKHICAHLCGNGLDPRAWNNPELQGRAYFRTKKGFIGLTARNAVLGDEVVLFSGGEVPFILRKHLTGISHSAERWKLIGDCFLDGWMYWHEGHWLYEPIIPESFQDGERSIVRRKFVLC